MCVFLITSLFYQLWLKNQVWTQPESDWRLRHAKTAVYHLPIGPLTNLIILKNFNRSLEDKHYSQGDQQKAKNYPSQGRNLNSRLRKLHFSWRRSICWRRSRCYLGYLNRSSRRIRCARCSRRRSGCWPRGGC